MEPWTLAGTMMPATGTEVQPNETLRSVTTPAEVAALPASDLSPWFNPFLSHFMRDVLRVGGEVIVAQGSQSVEGILLLVPTERLGSIFTRSPELATRLMGLRRGLGVFTDHLMTPAGEPYIILQRELTGAALTHRFHHPVRRLGPSDRTEANSLMREVHGSVDERWFQDTGPPHEAGFGVEMEGKLVGLAWATVAGRHGRLHSLAVRPGYRRVGVGLDLLIARLLWLRAVGATEAICEIAAANAASLKVADKGGFAPVGRLYLYDRP